MGEIRSLISVDKDGKFYSNKWIEWKHVHRGLLHCQTCLVLDGCWFNYIKKPKLPLHENCHCRQIFIDKPMPNISSVAKCQLEKFKDYIFADKYAWNGKKALFEKLGFTVDDSDYLKSEYEKQAVNKYCQSDYRLGRLDKHGQRINIDIVFNKENRQIIFPSGWMVRPKGIITNNTPLGE